MKISALGVIALAFSLGLALIVILKSISGGRWLVDNPNVRKLHDGSVPLVGGIAIYLAGCVTLALFLVFDQPRETITQAGTLYLIGLPLVIIGVLDDRFDVHPGYRLLVQISVSYLMIDFAGLEIMQLGDLFGSGNVVLGSLKGKLFTSFCVVGVINAINMIDGVDGLSGSVLLASLLSLVWVSITHTPGAEAIFLIGIILVGSLAAFLLVNLSVFGKENRVFLGDAGSMFLGLALVWLLIDLTQSGQASLSPIAAGWLFGVPLVDTVSVMVGRLLAGKSPLNPGRDHIHHQLMDNGFSERATVLVILLIQLALIAVGLVINANRFLEFPAFWLFVGLVVLHYVFTPMLIPVLRRSIGRTTLQVDQ